jgi:hypothetical protein
MPPLCEGMLEWRYYTGNGQCSENKNRLWALPQPVLMKCWGDLIRNAYCVNRSKLNMGSLGFFRDLDTEEHGIHGRKFKTP